MQNKKILRVKGTDDILGNNEEYAKKYENNKNITTLYLGS